MVPMYGSCYWLIPFEIENDQKFPWTASPCTTRRSWYESCQGLIECSPTVFKMVSQGKLSLFYYVRWYYFSIIKRRLKGHRLINSLSWHFKQQKDLGFSFKFKNSKLSTKNLLVHVRGISMGDLFHPHAQIFSKF